MEFLKSLTTGIGDTSLGLKGLLLPLSFYGPSEDIISSSSSTEPSLMLSISRTPVSLLDWNLGKWLTSDRRLI